MAYISVNGSGGTKAQEKEFKLFMEGIHQQLLLQLKTTVEGLLANQLSNVWHVYGGLNRLHSILEQIFKHGFKVFNPEGEPDCWIFIQGLSWLQPTLAASPTFITGVGNTPTRILRDKAMLWVYRSLESLNLSQKLSWLLSDKEHILSCYEPTAFLCQEKYSEAVLICLRAVEENQLSNLAEIDPCLYLTKWRVHEKCHRRCSSFPDAMHRTVWNGSKPKVRFSTTDTELAFITSQVNHTIPSTEESTLIVKDEVICGNNSEKGIDLVDIKDTEKTCASPHKLWSSLPSLLIATENETNEKFPFKSQSVPTKRKSITEPSSPRIINSESVTTISSQSLKKLSPSVLKVDYNLSKSESTKKIGILKNSKSNKTNSNSELIVLKDVKSGPVDITNRVNESKDDRISSSDNSVGNSVVNKPRKLTQPVHSHEITNSVYEATDSSSTVQTSGGRARKVKLKSGSVRSLDGGKYRQGRKKSFIEGGYSVQPISTAFFPKPSEGQSLTSFLSSGIFSQTNAELDRENAHFNISEAIIAAIEQVKCNYWAQATEETVEESDEEINDLKQRIRMRRRQNQEVKGNSLIWGISLLSDGKTDTTTTDQSASPLSTSPDMSSDSMSSDDFNDLDVDQVTPGNLAQLAETGLSVSMASLYSGAELSRPTVPNSESVTSAEGVALALLSRFSDKKLPRASDIQWLVSEEESTQELLPFPSSWPVSPDEAEDQDMRKATPLRGTIEWAPPRPQIIFTPHPPPKRRFLMLKQNYRCAGCGVKVAIQYADKFRYCDYLGRYFCTGCHTNQLAVIPGRVLQKWDFKKYQVSNFSYRLLDQMSSDALFNISDHLNKELYSKVRMLDKVRQLRLQIHHLKDFLLSCRFAERLQELLQKEPLYFLMKPEQYSLQDLLQVKSGELFQRLKELVEKGIAHVADCQLCQARGFVCVLCNSQEIIFPWSLNKVKRCTKCGSCSHISCSTVKNSCPRCIRISLRQKQLADNDNQ